jgi:hypothetical protein
MVWEKGRTWSISRIKHIYIDAEVDLGVTDTLLDLGNHAIDTEFVEVTGSDDLEAAALVVSEIALFAG